MDNCDRCNKRAELFHNDRFGGALCEACDAAVDNAEPTAAEKASARGKVYELSYRGGSSETITLSQREAYALWESILADGAELCRLRDAVEQAAKLIGPLRVPDGELAGSLVQALEALKKPEWIYG